MGERRQERIPFLNQQASGAEQLGGASPLAMNIVVDPTGTIFRRPGVASYCPTLLTTQTVSGLFTVTDGRVFAVAGGVPSRNVFLVSSSAAVQLGGDAPNVEGAGRPIFAETESLLAIAGGQRIQKVTLGTPPMSSRLGGDPPLASHVTANGLRLLANDVDEQKSFVFYSEQLSYENWFTGLSTGQFAADARPDPVVALWESSNEVCAFGTTSYQTFAQQADLTAPFATVAAQELGLSAVYSVVKIDEQFGWLDHLRRFVISDGRSVTIISDPIQKTLHDLSVVSDCFGYRVTIGYLDCFVWTFPTDGRTFSYQKGAGWSQWSSYSAANNWGVFGGTAATKVFGTDASLVGFGGYVGEFDLDTSTDLGSPINAYVVTGFINHDTDNRKTCKKLSVALKRGQTPNTAEAPQMLLSWRDNLGEWEPPYKISLGATGESYPVVEFYSLGVYRRRQWRIDFLGPEQFGLISVTEDFSVESN